MGRRREPGPRAAQGQLAAAARGERVCCCRCSLQEDVGVGPLEREGAHPRERRRRGRGRRRRRLLNAGAGDDERARGAGDGEPPRRAARPSPSSSPSSGHGGLQSRGDVRAGCPQVRHGQRAQPSQGRRGEQEADGAGDGFRVPEPRLGRRETQRRRGPGAGAAFPAAAAGGAAEHARCGADLDGVPERGAGAVHLERHDAAGGAAAAAAAALSVLLLPARRDRGSSERGAHHGGLRGPRGGRQGRRAPVLVGGRRGDEGQGRRRRGDARRGIGSARRRRCRRAGGEGRQQQHHAGLGPPVAVRRRVHGLAPGIAAEHACHLGDGRGRVGEEEVDPGGDRRRRGRRRGRGRGGRRGRKRDVGFVVAAANLVLFLLREPLPHELPRQVHPDQSRRARRIDRHGGAREPERERDPPRGDRERRPRRRVRADRRRGAPGRERSVLHLLDADEDRRVPARGRGGRPAPATPAAVAADDLRGALEQQPLLRVEGFGLGRGDAAKGGAVEGREKVVAAAVASRPRCRSRREPVRVAKGPGGPVRSPGVRVPAREGHDGAGVEGRRVPAGEAR